MPMPRATLVGYIYVLFAVLVWSGWIVVSRFSVTGTLDAYDLTAIRFALPGLVLLPVIWRKGLAVGPYGVKGGMLLALLMGAPYTNLAIGAMRFAPVSHATLLQGSLLFMTTWASWHASKRSVAHETFTPLRLFGVGCSLVGIGCFLFAHPGRGAEEQWVGHLLFILAGLLWGGYTLLTRAWRAEPLHAVALVCFWSLAYVPLYLWLGHPHLALANAREIGFQLFYQGLLTGILAFVAFTTGVVRLGAARASAMTPLVPVLSTFIAVTFLHEIPSASEWLGVGIVSLGVALAALPQRRFIP